MVGKKELCLAHNEISLAVEDHHISYYPEVKIRICSSCHVIVHHPPEAPEDFESLPKKLQELIRANIARKTEREKELGISLDYDDIDFEMKQEKLGLMKLINEYWKMKNEKMFGETHKMLPETAEWGRSSQGYDAKLAETIKANENDELITYGEKEEKK